MADVTQLPVARGPAHRLETVLRNGAFAVTAEISSPDSADPEAVLARAEHLAGHVDAINATDGAGAHCHMSSLGVCAVLHRAGYDPVMQVSCRDRNRIALQADALAAVALGVRNMVCLSGDGVESGSNPGAKAVFDLDGISLLTTLRGLRDESRYANGIRLDSAPDLFLGAASNPFVPPREFRPSRLGKKIAAGAQFVQTQYCFDVPVLRQFMSAVRELELHRRCFILVGVGLLRSAEHARRLRERVPGVHIPDATIERLARAVDPAEEGMRLCVETIGEIRQMEGVAGVHIMAHRQEARVAEIVERSGLLAERGRAPDSAPGAGQERLASE